MNVLLTKSYLRKGYLHYRFSGKRRLTVIARRELAYVWQNGRFRDDERFWHEHLGLNCEIGKKKGGAALRFYLMTANDLDHFTIALTEVQRVQFINNDESPEDEDDG